MSSTLLPERHAAKPSTSSKERHAPSTSPKVTEIEPKQSKHPFLWVTFAESRCTVPTNGVYVVDQLLHEARFKLPTQLGPYDSTQLTLHLTTDSPPLDPSVSMGELGQAGTVLHPMTIKIKVGGFTPGILANFRREKSFCRTLLSSRFPLLPFYRMSSVLPILPLETAEIHAPKPSPYDYLWVTLGETGRGTVHTKGVYVVDQFLHEARLKLATQLGAYDSTQLTLHITNNSPALDPSVSMGALGQAGTVAYPLTVRIKESALKESMFNRGFQICYRAVAL